MSYTSRPSKHVFPNRRYMTAALFRRSVAQEIYYWAQHAQRFNRWKRLNDPEHAAAVNAAR